MFYIAGECIPEHNIIKPSSNISGWILWRKQRNHHIGKFKIVVIQNAALESFLTDL
jgi:hypothetical protein